MTSNKHKPKTKPTAYWIVREFEHELTSLITKFSSLDEVKAYFEAGHHSQRARLYEVRELPFTVNADIGGQE